MPGNLQQHVLYLVYLDFNGVIVILGCYLIGSSCAMWLCVQPIAACRHGRSSLAHVVCILTHLTSWGVWSCQLCLHAAQTRGRCLWGSVEPGGKSVFGKSGNCGSIITFSWNLIKSYFISGLCETVLLLWSFASFQTTAVLLRYTLALLHCLEKNKCVAWRKICLQ